MIADAISPPLSKSLITVTLLHFGLVSLVCIGRSHCSDLVWKSTDGFSFRTGASETFQLNFRRVITNHTIVVVALEDTEIIEDQMLVASEDKADKEQKDHEENKVERI